MAVEIASARELRMKIAEYDLHQTAVAAAAGMSQGQLNDILHEREYFGPALRARVSRALEQLLVDPPLRRGVLPGRGVVGGRVTGRRVDLAADDE